MCVCREGRGWGEGVGGTWRGVARVSLSFEGGVRASLGGGGGG